MEKFTRLTSTCVPLRQENVDTDQIIPARYLLMITKTGFGEHVFQDWRYNEDGSEKKDFIINKPEYKGAEILIAGDNFGSGSSREHAVWALHQYGFKVVISTSFSDIFRNNAYGNGMLVIVVERDILNKLFDRSEKDPKYQTTVDLENQKIIMAEGEEVEFEIAPFVKEKLIKGMDNLDYVMSKEGKIEEYEDGQA